jgi:hypothetical protein
MDDGPLRDENFDPTKIPDKWYYFEAMDRAHMLMQHIDQALCNHPALDDEHAVKAAQAQALIMEIYQYAGRKLTEHDD